MIGLMHTEQEEKGAPSSGARQRGILSRASERSLFVRLLKIMDFAPTNFKDHQERRFHAEIVHLLFVSSRTGPTANVIAAILVSVALWSVIEPTNLLSWLSVILLLAFFRQRTVRFYLERKSHPQYMARSSLYWCLRLAIWTTLMALCWGLMPIILFPSERPTYQLFEALVLGGIAAAGVTTMSPLRGMVYLFEISILTPLFFSMYLWPGEFGQVLSVAVILFLIFMLRTAETFRGNLHFSIRLRLEKEDIAKSLEGQRKELDSANKRLDLALQESQAAGRMKSEFLANMSHEIRTPLNGVLGMIELSLGTSQSATQRNYLTLAQESADSLLAIINDILDLSKIEAGKMEVYRENFSLEQELKKALAIFTLAATEKGIKLQCKIDPSTPDCLKGDKLHLGQIITNLVGNAVKFTESGGFVEVRARQHSEGENLKLQFEVEDNGVGIAPEHQEMIFEAFSQADYSVNRAYGGTGLGLAICSRLVNMLDGEIWLRSDPGQGSTFYFTACFKAADLESATQSANQIAEQSGFISLPKTRIRILLAEDNVINQKVAGNLLKKYGFHVETAKNGQQAISMIDQNPPYDLILMDCQMPVLDGYAATRRLRAQGHKMPVIAITAHAMEGDKERCLAAGMNDYVSKPIRREELLSVISRHLEIARGS